MPVIRGDWGDFSYKSPLYEWEIQDWIQDSWVVETPKRTNPVPDHIEYPQYMWPQFMNSSNTFHQDFRLGVY
jgi:hypothetical protein